MSHKTTAVSFQTAKANHVTRPLWARDQPIPPPSWSGDQKTMSRQKEKRLAKPRIAFWAISVGAFTHRGDVRKRGLANRSVKVEILTVGPYNGQNKKFKNRLRKVHLLTMNCQYRKTHQANSRRKISSSFLYHGNPTSGENSDRPGRSGRIWMRRMTRGLRRELRCRSVSLQAQQRTAEHR